MHGVPPKNSVVRRELEAGVKTRPYEAVEGVLASHEIEELRFSRFIDDLGKNPPPIRHKSLARKGVTVTENLTRPLNCQSDNMQANALYPEGLHKADFHQIEKPQPKG